MKYTVIVEKSRTGYSAYVPDVPGCVAAGATREETLSLLREGLAMHLDMMRLDGEDIPQPTSTAAVLEVAA